MLVSREIAYGRERRNKVRSATERKRMRERESESERYVDRKRERERERERECLNSRKSRGGKLRGLKDPLEVSQTESGMQISVYLQNFMNFVK